MKVIDAGLGVATLEISSTECAALADLMKLAHAEALGIRAPEELNNRQDLATMAETIGSLFETLGLISGQFLGESYDSLHAYRVDEARYSQHVHKCAAEKTRGKVRTLKARGAR